MKAVGRLLLIHFAGSPAMKWLTISGLLLMLASLYVVLYVPQNSHMLALALPGLILFFLGTALMPLTFARLASGHLACILPGARVKLLISAVLTVLLVALPAGLLTPLAYVAGMSADVGRLREDPALFDYTAWLALYTYSSACIAASWAYVLIWFVGSAPGLVGLIKATAITLVLFALPFSARNRPDLQLQVSLLQFALLVGMFSVGFLWWPKLKSHLPAAWRNSAGSSQRKPREFAGREIDLLLGIARPWLMIGALSLPLLAIAQQPAGPRKYSDALFFLAIMSCISGAVAGQLPARARLLWLLGDWSRAGLFTAVEKSAWRHNGLVLMVLVALFLVSGSLAKFPPQITLAGLGLLLLGTVLSTYLGLMRTRGVYWLEAILGILVIASMMFLALLVSEQRIAGAITFSIMAILAVLAFGLRQFARRRWQHIDWSMSRNETQRALRAG